VILGNVSGEIKLAGASIIVSFAILLFCPEAFPISPEVNIPERTVERLVRTKEYCQVVFAEVYFVKSQVKSM
jgi:hypothetical protein